MRAVASKHTAQRMKLSMKDFFIILHVAYISSVESSNKYLEFNLISFSFFFKRKVLKYAFQIKI